MATKTYRVTYEHDGSMWFAHIDALEGCHTQGRTIAQARERIREALGLFDKKAAQAVLEDDVKLPKGVRADLKAVQAARAQQEKLGAVIRERTRRLARALTTKVGVSLGDAGELLGVSKQRVQQILEGAPGE